MIRIIAVGISYRTAPVEVRERFFFSDSDLRRALASLSSRQSVLECCIVSTCNRVEVYAVAEDGKSCGEEVRSFLTDFHGLSGGDLHRYMYSLEGKEAVRHLFRVAASIDSMVVGETQILNQLKSCFDAARLENTSGLVLNRLFNRAFFVGKKVRTETGISSQAVSISYLGVELAKRIFEDLANRTVMLVGTGEMGELFARYLVSNRIKDLYVTSRNFENARELAESLGGKPVEFDKMLYHHLKDMDILVTATASSDYIIRSEHVKRSLQLRKNDPIFMIDIAVPRNIDPKINEIPGVYLYDIDDLKEVQDENMNSRKQNLEKAEEIVLEVGRGFMNWMESLNVFPVIVELRKRFEKIKKTETEKALRRLEGTAAGEREIIESLANSIVGKIFHDPVTNLKKRASGYEGALYSEVTKRLFELEEQDAALDVDDEAENWNQR